MQPGLTLQLLVRRRNNGSRTGMSAITNMGRNRAHATVVGQGTNNGSVMTNEDFNFCSYDLQAPFICCLG